jgi:hypothetical protein
MTMFPFLGGLFGGGGAAAGGLGGLLGTINGIAGTVGGIAGIAQMLQMNSMRQKTQKLLQQEYADKRTARRTPQGISTGLAPNAGPLPGLDELLMQSRAANSQ